MNDIHVQAEEAMINLVVANVYSPPDLDIDQLCFTITPEAAITLAAKLKDAAQIAARHRQGIYPN